MISDLQGRTSAAIESDDWTPRPSDLPTARALRLAPELAGVEHNPVFRRALHRTRILGFRRRPLRWVAPSLASGIILAWLLTNPTGTTLALSVAALAVLVAATFALGWRNPRSMIGGLTVHEWGELADAGYPPREAALGCWATGLPRSDRPWGSMSAGFGLLLTALLFARFQAGSDLFDSALYLAMGGFEMGRAVAEARNPHAALRNVRKQVALQSRTTLGGSPSESEAESPTFGTRHFLVLLLIAVAGAGLSRIGIHSAAIFCFGFGAGGLFGFAASRAHTRDAPVLLEALTEEVAEAMRLARPLVRPKDF